LTRDSPGSEEQLKLDLLPRVFSARFAGEDVAALVRAKAQQLLPGLAAGADGGPSSSAPPDRR
jgi:hypothetical protein